MTKPKLRIGPSGPEAEKGELPSPFGEAAGNSYYAVNAPGTKITELGPDGSDIISRNLRCAATNDGPEPGAVWLPPRIPPVEFSGGVYEVEVNLGIGFLTSPPQSTNCGGLVVLVKGIDKDGVEVPGAVFTANPPSVTPVGLDSDTGGAGNVGAKLVKVVPFVLAKELTEEAARAVAGVLVTVARVDLPATTGGSYTNSSGYLELTRDTTVSIRRVR